jgi:hypothetical protein
VVPAPAPEDAPLSQNVDSPAGNPFARKVAAPRAALEVLGYPGAVSKRGKRPGGAVNQRSLRPPNLECGGGAALPRRRHQTVATAQPRCQCRPVEANGARARGHPEDGPAVNQRA